MFYTIKNADISTSGGRYVSNLYLTERTAEIDIIPAAYTVIEIYGDRRRIFLHR